MVFPSVGDPSSTFLASSVSTDSFFRGRVGRFTKRGPFVDRSGGSDPRRRESRWIWMLSYVGACPGSGAVEFVFVTAVDKCGQATKGAGWMSWHREAMKDAVACDKPREAGKRALIRGFPNEETRLGNPQSLLPECIG